MNKKLVPYAADDIFVLVRLLEKYVNRRGATLCVKPQRIISQILKYIDLRKRHMSWEIDGPHVTLTYPDNWTEEYESLWEDWLYRECSIESWEEEVIDPTFGTLIRPWETDGWRQEIHNFLSLWIQRSIPCVTENVESEEEEKESDIDPYLLEHGSAKQRKNASKG